MYEELIQNAKPKFNLQWYKDKDLYSDGAVEDTMIQLIAENEPEDYIEAIYEHYSWPVYYHLTEVRKNILNWYPFDSEGEVLEIGCGLGAITNMLCESCRHVTAVELSKRRATAALLRCRERDNLEIIVGNLNDIEFDKKFDYITLIGVFEYQGNYTETEHPYLDFLKKIRTLLKPNGKLLLAIENQYGLKYWCGAREDHTGIPFDGINQYKLSKKGVRTFSRAALDSLLKESGFLNTYFYYPLPDYKLPTVVYSEKCLPKDADLHQMACYYTDSMTMVAQERELYRDVIENQAFEFMANSFLVECSDSPQIGEVTFSLMSAYRRSEYQIGTRFLNNEKVEKFALKEVGKAHIARVFENAQRLAEHGLQVPEGQLVNGRQVEAYQKTTLLADHMRMLCKEGNKEELLRIFDWIYEEICKSSEEIECTEDVFCVIDATIALKKEECGKILKTAYLDMIPKNAFLTESGLCWIDQEWTLDMIPAKYVLYRAIRIFYSEYQEVNTLLPLSELFQKYQMTNAWQNYEKIEQIFIQSLIDKKLMAENRAIRKIDPNQCVKNLNKLMSRD